MIDPRNAFGQGIGNVPYAQPSPAGAHGSPTVAPMPPQNWMNMLPQAPTPADQLKQQQAGRADQGYNAIARLMADPQNRAPGGGLNQNAMAQLYGASPQIAMEYESDQAKIAQQTQATRNNAQKAMFDWQKQAIETFEPATVVYEDTLKKTGSEEAAQRAAQTKKDELFEAQMTSGMLTPEQRRMLESNRKYDYQTAKANILGLKGMKDEERAQKQDKRDIAGESRAAGEFSRKAEDKPENVEIVGPDGKKTTVLATYNQDTKQWTDNKGKVVEPVRKLGTKEGGDSNAALDSETLATLADQYIAGDRTVMQNIGRGTQGSKNIVSLRGEIAKKMAERGISGADMAAKLAEYDGMKAGMRTLGTRSANLELAGNEAAQLIPLTRELSHKINRTQFPALNSILMAGEKQTGDPDVVAFGQQLNSLIYVYMRALNPTGVPRVNDLEHARQLLDTAWTKGQMDAGLDQMQKEIDAARKSVSVTRGEMKGAISGREGEKPKEGAAATAQPGAPQQGAAMPPPEAISKLKEGIPTRFENGQVWTLRDGKPERVP